MTEATTPCVNCGYENRPGKKFCGGCGQPLALVCACCGTENPPGARFCDECGTPLAGPASAASAAPAASVPPPAAAPAPAAPVPVAPDSVVQSAAPQPAHPPVVDSASSPEEERRLVTALFCDLVGFTPLTETLDAEDVRDIQSEYFGKMSTNIARFGGTVEKYAGDAVLALFGAPIAHEDDAERAVLCALAMQVDFQPIADRIKRTWGVVTGLRVGVNTGEVISGTWDASGRQDVAVTGDALNTAARIQAAGNPGEVLVGLETMQLTRRHIEYGEQRDLVLKGKSGTVPGFIALGLREHFKERWETREVEAPLIGRERDLAAMRAAWERARDGEGQFVTVIGEAGGGKSRLINETLRWAGATSPLRTIRARCLSYGQQISLWLIADLLRAIFDIREQEGPAGVRSKLATQVPDLLSEAAPELVAEVMDVVGEVLGLPIGDSAVASAGAQIRHQALIRALRLLLVALTKRLPTALVLEDLHWIDSTSQDVLSEALMDTPGLRLVVLAAQRPGWQARWTEWGWTERITLRALTNQDVVNLASAVLGGATLSDSLQSYVTDRAGGNPFFVEEVVRALRDTGSIVERGGGMELVAGAEDRMPTTLAELLLARLDRLETPVRNVTQVASVVGRSFMVRLLAQIMKASPAVLDPPLTALQRNEIAFPRYDGSDVEYVFKHVSMRDLAYNTLVQKRRRQLHLEVARAIAALYPSDEYVEIIAYHYARTTEHAEAAVWLERAGDRAAAIYANEAAIGHFEEAQKRLEIVGPDPATAARLDEKQGAVLYAAGRYDEALAPLQRALHAYREMQRLEDAGRVAAQIGMAHRYQGTPDEGLAQIQPMLLRLAPSGRSEALAALAIALASNLFLLGRYQEAVDAAGQAADTARAIGNDRFLGEAEERRGTALLLLGQPEQALMVLEGALPLVEAGGDYIVLWRALNNIATTCEKLGEMSRVRSYTERCLQVAERMGNPSRTAFILANLGSTLITLGDWREARSALKRAMDLVAASGAAADATGPLPYLGQLSMYEGKWDDAARYLEEGLTLACQAGDRQTQEMVETFLAEVDLAQGRPEAATERLDSFVEQSDSNLGLLLPLYAWAQLETGDADRAATSVRRAVSRTREHHERFNLVHALWVESMILARRRQFDEAQADVEAALSMARSMPYPFAEARLLYQEGLLHARQRDHGRARERLREALTVFERLGAQPSAETARQAVQALDSGSLDWEIEEVSSVPRHAEAV